MKSKEPYITCIVSKGRAFRVKPMEEMVKNAHWFVPQDELEDYLEEYTMGSVHPCDNGLSNSRNDALEYCFKKGKICLMLDDDMKGAVRLINKDKTEKISCGEAINELYTQLINSPMNLGGFTMLTNMYWFNPTNNRISLKTPLSAQVMMIRPSKPRFDTGLEVSEDTDFTLQHIVEYGGALRINYMRIDCNHTMLDNKKLTFNKTMEGGIEYDLDKQKGSSVYMKKKWGNLVRTANTPYHVWFRV